MDDDAPKKRPPYELGQEIATLSVEELQEIAQLLRSEADRLEQAAKDKQTSLTAADAFFKS